MGGRCSQIPLPVKFEFISNQSSGQSTSLHVTMQFKNEIKCFGICLCEDIINTVFFCLLGCGVSVLNCRASFLHMEVNVVSSNGDSPMCTSVS